MADKKAAAKPAKKKAAAAPRKLGTRYPRK